MIPNIIHNPNREERLPRLQAEMQRQGIEEYNLWPAIVYNTSDRYRGVSHAHKQIVGWAEQEGLPEVLIMEDDVRFPAPNGYEHFLYNMPEDFDIYLGGVYGGEILKDGLMEKFTALHCYIIRQQFYQTFLDASESEDIDHALAGLGVYYVCFPFAAIQYDGWSDTQYQIMDYSSLLDGRLIYGLNC